MLKLDTETLSTYMWKLQKNENGEQESIKLIDCTNEQLIKFKTHCELMLTNTSLSTPGRYLLLDIVEDAQNKILSELYVRYRKKEDRCTEASINSALEEFLLKHKKTEKLKLKDVFPLTKEEYKECLIKNVQLSCMRGLGSYGIKAITKKFILSFGLSIEEEDYENNSILFDKDYSNEVILQNVALDLNLSAMTAKVLQIKDTGFTYNDLKLLLSAHNTRYADMSDRQLKLIKDVLLENFKLEVANHIKWWKMLIQQISEVQEFKITKNATC